MYQISLDIEKCEACGDCVDTCPTEVLVLAESDGGEVAEVVDADECIGWESCVAVCPEKEITITEVWRFLAASHHQSSHGGSGRGCFRIHQHSIATPPQAASVKLLAVCPPRASVSSLTRCSLLWYVTDTWSACVLTPWVGTPVVYLNHHAMHRPFSRNWEPIWQGAIDSPLSLLYHTLRVISRQNP